MYKQHQSASTPLLSAWQAGFQSQNTSDQASNEDTSVTQEDVTPIVFVHTPKESDTTLNENKNIEPETANISTPTQVQSPQQLFTEEDFPPLSQSTFSTPTLVLSPLEAPTHPMMTRAKAGIIKPNMKYVLFTVKANYPEPKTVKIVLQDRSWLEWCYGRKPGNA